MRLNLLVAPKAQAAEAATTLALISVVVVARVRS